jgi:hypothetical protein
MSGRCGIVPLIRTKGDMFNDIAKRLRQRVLPDASARPDFRFSALAPRKFRKTIMRRGAVMLRGAVDPALLRDVKHKLELLYAKYNDLPDAEFAQHLASVDPVERDHWEQINRSHVFDRTFQKFAGYSFFDIVDRSGLRDFVAQAFPKATVARSKECTSRRITDNQLHKTWDRPIEFHVDAQVFYDDRLSINFWTPLDPCGVTAPGLQVILLGVEQTKKYLEHNPDGYAPRAEDIGIMHHFRCAKMYLPALRRNGLDRQFWAPEFALGDVLALTNFTMHATHYEPSMKTPRTSVEVRLDLPVISS